MLDSQTRAEPLVKLTPKLRESGMWGPYRGVVEATLSHAEIVANPVHVMKQLKEAIAILRRNLQAHARLGIRRQRASAHRQKR